LLDLPQMTSATTGWTLRWTQWGRSATELVRTTDGGRTWTESEPLVGDLLSQPGSLGVAGPDAWLVLTSEAAPGPATFSRLYRTDDGGRHWAQLSTNLPKDCDNAGLTVATASAMWMTCSPSGPSLLVSRDGGTHWTAQVLPALPRGAGQYPDVQFLSPSDGVVMPQVPEGNRVPAAYITVNGGRTWTAAPQGLHVSDAKLLSFDFVSAGTWFAWYGQPQTQKEAPVLFQTRNSDRTWTSTTARSA
jgi:photosystem II stability/assembly factor-like uncharacterized protein